MLPDRWHLTTQRAVREAAARLTGLSSRPTELTGHSLNSKGELYDRHPELLDPGELLTSTVGMPVTPGPFTWKGYRHPSIFWKDMAANL